MEIFILVQCGTIWSTHSSQ